ncbi:helix-turn-helix domain-containing protein [Streptomyces sp. CB01580]|uniref:helix-turn-helix domain-containing protein n=1 Tax=Streptomyces sp. CB01580 TaxID=1703933 RepID=UPI00093C86E8|nr:helix-turn-helix domain-containing protein [Streptomyces sp. CB01580]
MRRITSSGSCTFAQSDRLAPHARAVAEAAGRRIGRPIAHTGDKIGYARLLKQQGTSLGQIAAKTGIPRTSLHRCLGQPASATGPSGGTA